MLTRTGGPPKLPGPAARPPDAPKIEHFVIARDRLLQAPQTAPLRFLLAVSAWTLAGEDILPRLPDPVLGPDARLHLPRLGSWAEGWRGDLAAAPPDECRAICAWLMKRLVRSLFEAVMLDLGVWSRDIHPCAKAAAHRFPAHADAIWRAAELAVVPTDASARIADAAEPLVTLLSGLAPHRA